MSVLAIAHPRRPGTCCWPPSSSPIGGVGLLVRRNPLVMFMCIELMLNAVNLSASSPSPRPSTT